MALDRDAGISEQLVDFNPHNSGTIPMPTRWTLSISASLRAVDENRPVISNAGDDDFPELERDTRILGIQTSVFLPLNATDHKGREMTLSVHSRVRLEVPDDEISFLLTLGQLAAIAINKEKKLQHERSLSSGLKRAFEIGSSLVEQELVHGSLDAVMQRVEIVMKYPFVLLDHRTEELLAYGSPFPDIVSGTRWPVYANTHLREFFLSLSKLAKASDFQDVITSNVPFDPPIAAPTILEPIHLNNRHVGTLVVFPPETGMDSADQVIAQAVRLAINVQFLRDYFLSREESGSLTAFFSALLDGSFESEREAHIRGRQLGIDLQESAKLLVFDVNLAQLDDAALVALNKIPGSLPFRIAIAFKDDLLLAYVPEFERGRAIHDSVEKELKRRINIITRRSAAYTRSTPCQSLSDFMSAFTRCKQVLRLARHFGKDGLVRGEDFGASPLMFYWADDPVTKSFLKQVVEPIEIYDRENSTDLLNTVRVFVDTGRKFQATARLLNIHLSTLRYRITRLHEIFGVDLDDADVAFNFSLALRIKAMTALNH